MLCDEDRAENELAVERGDLRVLSVYPLPGDFVGMAGCGDRKVYLITEADRSATTALFPSEY